MALATLTQVYVHPQTSSKPQFLSAQRISQSPAATTTLSRRQNHPSKKLVSFSGHRKLKISVKISSGKNDVVSGANDEEGISLGTMKLPAGIDIPRFETLLFQWANSLCQGAQLPLPVPLKVDKIEGGVRLGFVEIDNGKTEIGVYIDCLVSPPGGTTNNDNEASFPVFTATRKGISKNKVPPGEPRIMKSLLAALKKAAEIARI